MAVEATGSIVFEAVAEIKAEPEFTVAALPLCCCYSPCFPYCPTILPTVSDTFLLCSGTF